MMTLLLCGGKLSTWCRQRYHELFSYVYFLSISLTFVVRNQYQAFHFLWSRNLHRPVCQSLSYGYIWPSWVVHVQWSWTVCFSHQIRLHCLSTFLDCKLVIWWIAWIYAFSVYVLSDLVLSDCHYFFQVSMSNSSEEILYFRGIE